MVEEHVRNPGQRSVCIREVQKVLRESAKLLIEDTLKRYGLGSPQGFSVLNDRIMTPGGGMIIFQGMNDQTAESIKSLESFDRAWIEEAHTLSNRSLEILRPTIRNPGSELWFSYNRRRKTDPVDKLFSGEEIPTDAIVVDANWRDNPDFPAVLEQERIDCLRINPEQYEHIWEGGYVTVMIGAYYSRLIAEARQQHRICLVAPEKLIKYYAFWDLGGTSKSSDAKVTGIVQFVGREIRILDYYETVGQTLDVHIQWMMENGYTNKNTAMILPHDGSVNDRIYDVSFESELRKAGYNVTVVKNQGAGAAMQRIDAGKKIFPECFFNKDKTEPLLESLGWYHEKKDEKRDIGLGPEHDWSSHGSDMFGLIAIMADTLRRQQIKPREEFGFSSSGSWMG